MPAPDQPLLQLRDVSKTFDGTRVLKDVDLSIGFAETHGLVGQNGSGKSTLIKILAGFHAPDDGATLEIAGEPVDLGHHLAVHEAGVRFVHQDLALVSDLNAVENLALGRGYETGRGGRIHWSRTRREAAQRLAALGFECDLRVPVAQLPLSQRTGIAIARALFDADAVRVLVLDEPTASLPAEEASELFAAIDRLRERGMGVLYVTHHLDEIFAITDRVTVLRDGVRVATVGTETTDRDSLIKLLIGDAVELVDAERGDRPVGEAVMHVSELCGEVVAGASFTAHAGEVLGIAGLTGSGREEILPLIFGASRRTGSVIVGATQMAADSPQASKAAGVAFVPSDRHRAGSVLTQSVRENCTITDLRRFAGPAGALNTRAERREVQDWIARLDIRPADAEAIFATLSGGNQQKAVLAKWLRIRPSVLLLDEPTQGVDVHATAMIHALSRSVADAGSSVVVASSDDRELCAICDRVLVMHDGAIVAELTGDQINRHEIGRQMHGVVVDEAGHLEIGEQA